jgi:UDP-2,3-diacylglucosamine hydrolase
MRILAFMTTLFVSDVHLDLARPHIMQAFMDFLQHEASSAEAVYILGDLFELWAGDDVGLPRYEPVITALRTLSAHGVRLYFLPGNRDFLIGHDFCAQTGMQILREPVIIQLANTPTVLMHGDTLCTDDIAYQRFRRIVHQAWLQRLFLRLPVTTRWRMAERLRARTSAEVKAKPMQVMDVNDEAVAAIFRRLGVTQMIHGHTHRAAIHELNVDGIACRRIVLGDWYEQGSLLRCDSSGCQLLRHSLTTRSGNASASSSPSS